MPNDDYQNDADEIRGEGDEIGRAGEEGKERSSHAAQHALKQGRQNLKEGQGLIDRAHKVNPQSKGQSGGGPRSSGQSSGGRVKQGLGKLSGNIGKVSGNTGKMLGRLSGEGGKRVGFAAGRGGKAVGQGVGKLASTAGKGLAKFGGVWGAVAVVAVKHWKIVVALILINLIVYLTLLFIFASVILCLKKFIGSGPVGAIKSVISIITGNKSCNNPEDADGDTVTVTKTGPVEVKNPDGKGPDLKYTIKVDYQGQAQDIIITDDILTPNVTFVSASGTHTTTPPGDGPDVKSITWSATSQGSNQAGGQTFTADGTGYYPANTKLEGGPNDMQGKPLRTLQDFLTGKVIDGEVASYVSVAMDKTLFPYGTELTIVELDKKYGKHIPFRVVDTGSAFTGKGTSRIDICTANETASLDPTINGKLTIQKGNAPSVGGFSNLSFDVVFRPKDKDSYVINKATAILVGAGGGGGINLDTGTETTGYAAPSDNACNGKYTAAIGKTPLKKNFGDPACVYTKDKLFTLLQKEDSKNARYWFDTVIKCESGYNPNAYAGHAQTGTPDASGAWGLYQMGSSKPPGSAPPAKGKNGEYDRGDINWQIQTTNAINYRDKTIGGKWTYWACAKSKW